MSFSVLPRDVIRIVGNELLCKDFLELMATSKLIRNILDPLLHSKIWTYCKNFNINPFKLAETAPETAPGFIKYCIETHKYKYVGPYFYIPDKLQSILGENILVFPHDFQLCCNEECMKIFIESDIYFPTAFPYRFINLELAIQTRTKFSDREIKKFIGYNNSELNILVKTIILENFDLYFEDTYTTLQLSEMVNLKQKHLELGNAKNLNLSLLYTIAINNKNREIEEFLESRISQDPITIKNLLIKGNTEKLSEIYNSGQWPNTDTNFVDFLLQHDTNRIISGLKVLNLVSFDTIQERLDRVKISLKWLIDRGFRGTIDHVETPEIQEYLEEIGYYSVEVYDPAEFDN